MASDITSLNGFSGARAEIYVGDKLIGRAQGINGTYSITNIGIEEMGEATPTAFITVGSNVNFTVQKVSKIGDDPMSDGLMPDMNTEALITSADMVFQVIDKLTNTVKYRITGCRPDGSQSFGATPRTVFIDGMSFVGTGFSTREATAS